MSEWREVKLGSVLPFKYGKNLPVGKRTHSGEFPVVSSAGFIDSHDEAVTKGPTIVVGRKGSIGNVFYSATPVFPIDTTFYVEEAEDLDLRFGYYLLKSLPLKEMNTDAAVPGLKRDNAENIDVSIPPMHLQRHIARILGSIDDLIENNRRQVELLEQMARAIYKEWFVHFRYPGHENVPLVDSELGPIPQGWETGTLKLLTAVSSGKRPPSRHPKFSQEAPIPVVGASSVMAYTEQYLINEKVLVTGRVGTHGIVQRFDEPIWPSDNTLVIKPLYIEYVYQLMQDIDYLSLNRGAAQPLISQKDILNVSVISPPTNILLLFEEKISEFFEYQKTLLKDSSKLENIRDALLPKLVTGQIDVSKLDLDALVSEAVTT